MISKEELTTFKAKFEEAEKNLEKEKISKEEMVQNLKSEGQISSDKIFEFESLVREKETQVLDLNHQLSKAKLSSEETEGKFSKLSTDYADMKKNYQELSISHKKDKSLLIEKDEELSKLVEEMEEIKASMSAFEKDKTLDLGKIDE